MMGFFDRFKRQAPEKKNYYPPMAFADFLSLGGDGDLLAYESMRLYKKCTPFYQAVNIRSTTGAGVPVRLIAPDDEIVAKHKLIDLLAKPNPSQTWTSFARAMLSYFDVCGEAFFIVTLGARGEPLEIYIPRPNDLTACANNRNPFSVPESWRWQTPVGHEVFTLSDDELGGSYRYVNYAGDKELWQWADFNPEASYNNYRGMPKASPLWLQIQQFIEADTNNYSILMRGARPSVAWVWKHDQPMTDDQFERWKEQVKAYEGAQNAGRQVLVDNLDPKVISITNRDMEFAANRKTVRSDIFSAYGIPLALVSSDNMTMDNLKVSTSIMYDNAILPLLDDFFSDLTSLLIPRYRDLAGYRLGYAIADISALKTRSIDETKAQSAIGVLTDNELRTQLGYEAVQGGDSIYKPSSSVPVGQDVQTGDNIDAKKARFVSHMQSIKQADGTRSFSDDYIAKAAESHFNG